MPTYDYVCDSCEHQFEHRQSMTSNRLRTCPHCKQRKLRRLIGSGAGVIFKGSGFYETDYKRKTGGPSKKSDAAKNESEPAPEKAETESTRAAAKDGAKDGASAGTKSDPTSTSKSKKADD